MARVPTFDPGQIASPTTNAGNDYQQIQVNPNAFGAGVGAAVERAGGQAMQGASDVAQTDIRSLELQNENSARDMFTAVSRQASEASGPYFATRGQARVDGYQPFLDKIQGVFQGALDSTTNPTQRKLLADSLTRTQAYYFSAAKSAYSEGVVQASKASSAASADQHINNALVFRNDPDKVTEFVQAGANDIHSMAEIDGMDDATAKDQIMHYNGKAYGAVIAQRAMEDPMAAQAILTAHEGEMDAGSVIRATEILKPRLQKAGDDAALASFTQTGPPLGTNVDRNILWGNQKLLEHGVASDGTPLVSSAGAVGVSQILPSTAADVAKTLGVPFDPAKLTSRDQSYNEMLGKAYSNQLLDKYQSPTLALAAYNAGPANVDKWIAANGDPRTGTISNQDFINKIPFQETKDYVQKITNATNVQLGSSTPQQTIDPAGVVHAMAASSNDPATQMRRVALAQHYLSVVDGQNAQARASIQHDISNNIAPALEQGQTVTIPEQQIRSAFPQAQADQIMSNLHLQQQAGQLFSGLKLATPDDIATAKQALISGQGIDPSLLPGKTAQMVSSPGADGAPALIGADMKTRLAVASQLDRLVANRNAALKADAPGYLVNNDPNLRALYQATTASNADPQAQHDFAAAMLAQQERLGVPPDQRGILPQADVAAMADKLKNTDPSKFDPGATMDALQSQYKEYWPQVFGQLVRNGVPPVAEVIGAMDTPGQAGARQDMVRAYQFAGAKGVTALKADVSKENNQQIASGLPGALDALRQTMLVPGAAGVQNQKAFTNTQNAIETLATYYAGQGGAMSGTAALQKATDGVLGAYDFEGTMRVPKGLLPVAEMATRNAETNLKADDLAPVPAEQGSYEAAMPDARRREIMARAPKTWMPSGDDLGLIAMAQLPNGAYQPVMLKNGKALRLDFADMSKSQGDAPPDIEGATAPPNGGLGF